MLLVLYLLTPLGQVEHWYHRWATIQLSVWSIKFDYNLVDQSANSYM